MKWTQWFVGLALASMLAACGSAETPEPEGPAEESTEAVDPPPVEARTEEPCDVALAEEEARREVLAEEVGQAPPFNRERYLERCRAQPVLAQRCMSRNYAEGHVEECAPPAFPGDPEGAPS